MSNSGRHKKTPSVRAQGVSGNESNYQERNVMANNSTALTVDNLPSITHAGRPVVTTALLAKLYGSDDGNITRNYQRNIDRFVAGKHFFKLEGAELKALKDYTSSSRVVQIPKNTRQMILWTERGAARHAKMLDTEQAWEVFEKLEDSYFGKGQAQAQAIAIEHKLETLTPAHQRHILNRVAELAGMDRKKYPAVWRGIKDHFQVGSYKDIPDSQYPAVCEFMLCKPLDGEIPTARVIEQASGIYLDQHEAQHLYLMLDRFWKMFKYKDSMLSAARALGSSSLMDIFDHLYDGHGSYATLNKRKDELTAVYESLHGASRKSA
ncbi:ORF6N domain-containing protein [Pseudomonas sp. A1437]|uniref:ORF6N domain-containing protein n=1 Tax=unclassified Pseudomonas TaxID=196821 RepID=UPI00378410A3